MNLDTDRKALLFARSRIMFQIDCILSMGSDVTLRDYSDADKYRGTGQSVNRA